MDTTRLTHFFKVVKVSQTREMRRVWRQGARYDTLFFKLEFFVAKDSHMNAQLWPLPNGPRALFG